MIFLIISLSLVFNQRIAGLKVVTTRVPNVCSSTNSSIISLSSTHNTIHNLMRLYYAISKNYFLLLFLFLQLFFFLFLRKTTTISSTIFFV